MSFVVTSIAQLPERIRAELQNVGYHKADITVQSRDHVQIASAGAAGEQAFAVILHENGKRESYYGSWGGPNIASGTNRVDNLTAPPVVPPAKGAIIVGRMGRKSVYAVVIMAPTEFCAFAAPADADIVHDAMAVGRTDAVNALLGRPDDALSDTDRRVLYCYGALKSGEYRRNALAEISRQFSCDAAAIADSLVQRGYLKRAANGATQITTQGKNARRGHGETW